MSGDELTDDLVSEIIADAEEYVGLSQSAVRKGWRIGDKLLKAKDAMPSDEWLHFINRRMPAQVRGTRAMRLPKFRKRYRSASEAGTFESVTQALMSIPRVN